MWLTIAWLWPCKFFGWLVFKARPMMARLAAGAVFGVLMGAIALEVAVDLRLLSEPFPGAEMADLIRNAGFSVVAATAAVGFGLFAAVQWLEKLSAEGVDKAAKAASEFELSSALAPHMSRVRGLPDGGTRPLTACEAASVEVVLRHYQKVAERVWDGSYSPKGLGDLYRHQMAVDLGNHSAFSYMADSGRPGRIKPKREFRALDKLARLWGVRPGKLRPEPAAAAVARQP